MGRPRSGSSASSPDRVRARLLLDPLLQVPSRRPRPPTVGRRRTPGVDARASVAHGRPTDEACSVTDALGSLLRASHLLAPDDLAATAAAEARRMGVRETVLYLADY